VPFPSLKALQSLGVPLRRTRGRWRWAFLLFPLALLIVAIARPRVPKGEIPDPRRGIDIMLALDFSSSMRERDYHLEGKRVTRKEALIHVVKNFIAGREHDRLGIVAFARGPWLVSPLTLDHEWALAAFKETETSRGTAIGEGVMTATWFLKKSSDRTKIIIVVSDGENSAGRKPAEVIPYVKKEQVRVYSVLIGPQKLLGRQLMDHDMFELSKATGGQFFQASDTHSLESVYQMIDLLEKKEFVQKRHQTYRELFPFLAAAALVLVLGQVTTRDLLRRRIP
jgi:Ca-activated chloride channel family protein